MIAWVKLAILFVLIAASAFAGWTANGWRLNIKIDKLKLESANSILKFEQDAREKESFWTNKLQEAYNAKSKREQELEAAVADSRGNANRLLNSLAEARRELSTSTIEACRVRANTISNVFGQCVQRYQELGYATDRHVNDKQTLIQAWPKK